MKEPNHFSAHEFDATLVRESHLNDVDPARYVARARRRPAQFAIFRARDDYEALFDGMRTPWRMEASTSYLSCPEAAAMIAQYAPDARIIVVTRDPVERACSHYRLARRTGRLSDTLAKALDEEISGQTPLSTRFLLRPSRQNDGIARVRANFPSNQCIFIKFDQLRDDPAAVLSDIAGFLGVGHDGFDLSQQARNASHAARYPKLNEWLEKTGVKTALRRVLPGAVKQAVKPLWFDAGREVSILAEDRARLAILLAGEGV